MPEEKKIDVEKLSATLELEFKNLLADVSSEVAAQPLIDYAAYLTEKTTLCILEGRPDLAESFKEAAEVRAAALRVKLTKEKSTQIAMFAGSVIRILAGALL